MDSTSSEENKTQPILVENAKGKSAVWKYFAFDADESGEPTNNDRPVCKQCFKAVATKGDNTTNMAKHLKDKHPNLYSQMKQVCKLFHFYR